MKPTTRALFLLASVGLLGADWPGRERELLTSLQTATPGRRIEILHEIAATPGEGAQRAIVTALSDADPAVRIAAAGLAQTYKITAARETLMTWLGETTSGTRAAAISALGVIGDATSLGPIVRLLGDSDPDVRLAAVSAIAALGGTDATVPLLDRLVDPETSVRLATARALGEMSDTRAVLPLLGTLQDSMPEVRERAATALGRLRDPRALRGLLGLLRDSALEVRIAAVRALGALGRTDAVIDLIPLALRDDRTGDEISRTQMARVAIESIGQIGGSSARDVLVRVIRRADRITELVRAASDALLRMGPLAEDAIPQLVATPMNGDVVETVSILGHIGGERATEALIDLFESPRGASVRDAVLRELGRSGTPGALRTLLRAIATSIEIDNELSIRPGASPPNSIRAETAVMLRRAALGGLELYASRNHGLDPEAVDPLKAVLAVAREAEQNGRNLASNSSGYLMQVMRLVGHTHNPKAAELLAPMLDYDSSAIRESAARALIEVGVEGIEPTVVRRLADSSESVRLAVGEALGRFGTSVGLEALQRLWHENIPIDRGHAALAMARIGSRVGRLDVVTDLSKALRENADVTGSAVIDALSYLAEKGSPEAITLLTQQVASMRLGTSAVEALSNAFARSTGPVRTQLESALQSVLASSSVAGARATAMWGLGNGTERSIPTLEAGLRSLDVLEATNAAGALARQFSQATMPNVSNDLVTLLCDVALSQTWPALRSNALMAIARGGLTCNLEAQRTILREGRARFVRRAAAESLRVMAQGDSEDARLARHVVIECSTTDRDPDVAARCRALALEFPPETAGSPATTAVSTPPASEPVVTPSVTTDPAPTTRVPRVVLVLDENIDALLVRVAGDVPAQNAMFGLLMEDGVTRVGYAGPGGWIHERPAPAGTFTVVDPVDLLPEP